MNSIDITKLPLHALKAMAYDEIMLQEQSAARLRMLNQEIGKKTAETQQQQQPAQAQAAEQTTAPNES